MINIKHARMFCKDEISKIENYDKAIADKSQTWECHHRLELTLNGEFAHTHADLKRLEMYYKRPYFELIFLSPSEHRRLHAKVNMKDKKFTDEHKDKLRLASTLNNSKYWKDHTMSDEHRRNIEFATSRSKKGKHWHLENGHRVWTD